MNIEYRRIPLHLNADDFDKIARPIATCDQFVYGDDPSWREGMMCPACKHDSKKLTAWTYSEAPDRCPYCSGILVECFPIEKLLADYRINMVRTDYVFVVAYQDDLVIGAFQGWSMTADELERHLNGNLPDFLRASPSIMQTLRAEFPNETRFAYESSIFVLHSHQGLGIGKKLVQMGQQVLWDQNLRTFVMRTMTFPHASSYPWYKDKLGYRQIAAYADVGRRVIMVRSYPTRP